MLLTNHQKIFAALLLCFLAYTVIVYTKGTEISSPIMSEQAMKGKLLWQKYNCTACHQLYGLGGYLGPDLTNEISTRDTRFVAAILKSGTKAMPDFKLTEDEIKALIEFLRYTDQTGKFPNNKVKFDNFGGFNLVSDVR
jgi:nitric oxide reductase subunit C